MLLHQMSLEWRPNPEQARVQDIVVPLPLFNKTVWVYSSSKFIKVTLKSFLICFHYCLNEITWEFPINWIKDINTLQKMSSAFFFKLISCCCKFKKWKIYLCMQLWIKINYISILNDPEFKNRDWRMKHVDISYMQ